MRILVVPDRSKGSAVLVLMMAAYALSAALNLL